MPSPADTGTRRRVERALRMAGLLAIAAWIVNAIMPRSTAPIVVATDRVHDALPHWTRDATVAELRVRIDTTPDATSSAWLAALQRAGTTVGWFADTLTPIAVESWPAADPAGGTVVLSTSGEAVIGDALGPIDTLTGSGVTAVRLASAQEEITLTSASQPARVTLARDTAPREAASRVYVAGAAGWEAKFVIAALEEAGWTVDARLFVAPGHEVTQGAVRAPDVARHAAVILLDSAAAEAVSVTSYARAGGGVVLAGDANRSRRVAALVAWQAGRRQLAPLGTMAGDTVWRGLSRLSLAGRPGAAITLEQRGSDAAVVARRYYTGRVAGVGYDATWRWRMAGDEGSVDAHRAWWSRLVASVASRPAQAAAAGAAPIAALHASLGPAASWQAGSAELPRDLLANLLGAIALAALLAEWLSRRARGAR